MYLFPPFADTFENVRGEVVVFYVLKTTANELTQVEGLRAPGLRSQQGKPLLGFG